MFHHVTAIRSYQLDKHPNIPYNVLMKKRTKIIIFTIVTGLLLLTLTTLWAAPILQQEANTPALLMGIGQLLIQNDDIILYDQDESTQYYVSISQAGSDPMIQQMAEDGWIFTDQMGSGYFFVRTDDNQRSRTVASRQFTRYFRIWMIPIGD